MVDYKKFQDIINNIEFIPSPNFSSRSNHSIDLIIIHYTASNRIGSAIDWFQRKESKVSAHYLIGRDGRIVQMVKDENKAWHAGYSHWDGEFLLNKNSIGIELVGNDNSGFTPVQMEVLSSLCFYLMDKHNIKIKRIIGHEHCSGVTAKKRLEDKGYPYSGKTDPGRFFNWAELIEGIEVFLDDADKLTANEPIESDLSSEDLCKPEPEIDSGNTHEDSPFIEKLIYWLQRLFKVIFGVRCE